MPLTMPKTRPVRVQSKGMVATKTDSLHPESSKRIRSVIADHREMSRYGMRRLMEDAPDFAVVGEAGDAAAALRLVLDHHPDLVLLDTSMPGMSPFTAGRLIEQDGGGTRIVYLTTQEDEQRVRWTLRSGPSGYLLKETPAPLLLDALREVYRGADVGGERSLSPPAETQPPDDVFLRTQPVPVPLRRSTLTLREREVMKLLAEGHTAKKAAAILGLSTKTVEAHKFNLMRKLDIHNKAQLVTVAIQQKILPMPFPM
jgi:two-component system response regulator NreC